MREFYVSLLARGRSPLEALRAAQLALLNRNRAEHGAPLPSTWSGFVVSGDWR